MNNNDFKQKMIEFQNNQGALLDTNNLPGNIITKKVKIIIFNFIKSWLNPLLDVQKEFSIAFLEYIELQLDTNRNLIKCDLQKRESELDDLIADIVYQEHWVRERFENYEQRVHDIEQRETWVRKRFEMVENTFRNASISHTVATLQDELRSKEIIKEDIDQNELTLPLKSCLCKQGHLELVMFQKICDDLQVQNWIRAIFPNQIRNVETEIAFHRKAWEFCFIIQALKDNSMLEKGKKGIGFAVGMEPIPSYLATKGCRIMATDLSVENSKSTVWVDSNQNAQGQSEQLNFLGLCNPTDFAQNVEYRNVDMTCIPDDLQEFDFCWSSCAVEHVGSLEKSKEVLRCMMKVLKPGGVAVHTTEYNLSSNTETLESGGDSAFSTKGYFGAAMYAARRRMPNGTGSIIGYFAGRLVCCL